MSATAELCAIFNKWFDCLNGRYLTEGAISRNPNLGSYFANQLDDPRYNWLELELIQWLKDWELEVQNCEGLTGTEKKRLILSRQTLEGLQITTVSFLELTRSVLSEEGASFLLAEKLNQDRVEAFLGKLMRGCGNAENHTVDQARKRILALLVAGRCFIRSKNTNCSVDEHLCTCIPPCIPSVCTYLIHTLL